MSARMNEPNVPGVLVPSIIRLPPTRMTTANITPPSTSITGRMIAAIRAAR